MKYYYFREEWTIEGFHYVSHYKVTKKSLNWNGKINDTSEFIPKPSTKLKRLLKDTLIHVSRTSKREGLIQ